MKRSWRTVAVLACVTVWNLTSEVGSAAQASRAANVSFTRDVAPLLDRHCVSCHRPDGPAPFPLTTYEAARRRASQIAAVTRARYMPPWKSVPGYGTFQGKPLLTGADIDAIGRWADQRQDTREDRRWHAKTLASGGLGKPDLVVDSESYELEADGADVYHLFVIPIPIAALRYVRGVEFLPSTPGVVHHANILLDRTPTSRARAVSDPALGEGGGLPITAEYPPGHFLGWVPGQQDVLVPQAFAWPLRPGTDLVVQLHLKPMGKPATVKFSVGFFFQTEPGTETPAMLRLGLQSIEIPAGDPAHVVTDSYALPVDVDVLALKPHAHYRAKRIETFATDDAGRIIWLLRIDDWDFRWQHVYRLTSPIRLPRASVLTTRITYDNSAGNPRNPEVPPRRVRWGPGSLDEMGDVWVQVRAIDEGDRSLLNQDFRRKWVAEDLVGTRAQVEDAPASAALRTDLGVLLLEAGRAAEALDALSAALRLRSDVPDTHVNLGLALRQAGRPTEAIAEYREALRLAPAHVAGRYNLANALNDLKRFDEAAAEYREVLRLDPAHARAHNNLGLELLRRSEVGEATAHFQEAIRRDPELAEAHYNLARVLQAERDLGRAAAHFRTAVRLRSDATGWIAELAWLLATAPDDKVRNGQEALRLVERARRLAGQSTPELLDVLAAALAENGAYDRALEAIGEAIRLSPPAGATALLDRQERYRARRPYRQP